MQNGLEQWLGGRKATFLGTNHKSEKLPFQSWYHFKEAYAPEFVKEAIESHPSEVNMCLDPFGGSGTTALTCQMAGVSSVSVEVNPFLADLICAKTERHTNLASLQKEVDEFLDACSTPGGNLEDWFTEALPPTFIEPGRNGRWLFNRDVAVFLQKAVQAIADQTQPEVRRFLRVGLASQLITLSNVIVNGKGRRYRRNWQTRQVSCDMSVARLGDHFSKMIADIRLYSNNFTGDARVWNADVRSSINVLPDFDLAVFSPPYPNSFDYTDVYNIELWVLRYLQSRVDNRNLRSATLSSHVQLNRQFRQAPKGAPTLAKTLTHLEDKRTELWNANLADMVAGYFAELNDLIVGLGRKKKHEGRIWIMIGNSRYGGIEIETGSIVVELAKQIGLRVYRQEDTRLMRSSPQQGGMPKLAEQMIVLG